MKQLFWMILFFPLLVQAKTTLRFEPNEISLGESTRLILESTQNFKKEPNFSALQGKFAISHQEQGTSSFSFNGHRETHHTIVLTLFPRQQGELSTGDIIVNGKPIEPATLTVLPASAHNALPITFTAKINETPSYVQGLILYTITVSDGAGLMDAQITTPEVPNARVMALNLDKMHQELIDGKPTQIIERTFGIIPEKSGPLTIPPTELYGIIANLSPTSPAALFDQGMLFDGLSSLQKEIRLETNPIQISVQPQPTDWVGWWLPATSVSLTADDSFTDSVSVGDSLARTITLSATGVEGSQLPLITHPTTSGLKIYPSPEQRDTILTPTGEVQGTIKLSLVFVPTKNGELTIPAVSVPWFNTKTGRTEFATLPPKTLHATGQTIIEQPQPVKKVQSALPQTPQPIQAQSKTNPWMIALFSVLGVIIGLAIGFFVFRTRHKHKSYRITDTKNRGKAKKKPLPDLYPL